MHLLTILSLIYAGILVLALAASLLLIFWHLVRIGRALAAVEVELSAVAKQTEVLEPNLKLVADEVSASRDHISLTHTILAPIAGPLARLAGKLGIARPA